VTLRVDDLSRKVFVSHGTGCNSNIATSNEKFLPA
jgi:hypothetical protein